MAFLVPFSPYSIQKHHFSPFRENIFWKTNYKGAKNGVFVINKVKNGPKRPYNRPKRAKMYEKRQKIEF